MLSFLHPFFLVCAFLLLSLLSLAAETWQEEANHIFQSQPGPAAHRAASGQGWWQPHATQPAHCALEAVVVVAAAPLAEATVKREFWMDSAEVEVA